MTNHIPKIDKSYGPFLNEKGVAQPAFLARHSEPFECDTCARDKRRIGAGTRANYLGDNYHLPEVSPGPLPGFFFSLLFERLIHSFKSFFGRRKHAAKETDKKSGESLTVC